VRAIGVSTSQNKRRSMEDTYSIQDVFGQNPKMGYFGVYDGHGGAGASKCAETALHENLLRELQSNQGDCTREMWQRAFETTHQQIGRIDKFSGTTVVSCLVYENSSFKRVLSTANVGDARATLLEYREDGSLLATRLSHDHKPSDADEIARIQQAKGFVSGNRVNGILAVPRALGDMQMAN